MPFHVYILHSKKLNSFYVGSTSNIANRLNEHNNGESTYTSTGTPWTLIWTTSKPTRPEAEILELKIKNLSSLRKIRFMLKYRDGIVDPSFFDLK